MATRTALQDGRARLSPEVSGMDVRRRPGRNTGCVPVSSSGRCPHAGDAGGDREAHEIGALDVERRHAGSGHGHEVAREVEGLREVHEDVLLEPWKGNIVARRETEGATLSAGQ